jgi:hypothetical protein
LTLDLCKSMFADGDAIPFTFGEEVLLEELRVLPVLGSVTLVAPNLGPSIRYVQFEAHAFLYNLTMSYDQTLVKASYVNGTNIGLVAAPKGKSAQVFLHSFNIEANVTVLVVAKALKVSGRNCSFLIFYFLAR